MFVNTLESRWFGYLGGAVAPDVRTTKAAENVRRKRGGSGAFGSKGADDTPDSTQHRRVSNQRVLSLEVAVPGAVLRIEHRDRRCGQPRLQARVIRWRDCR